MKRITVSMDDDLHAAIAGAAERADRNLAQQMRHGARLALAGDRTDRHLELDERLVELARLGLADLTFSGAPKPGGHGHVLCHFRGPDGVEQVTEGATYSAALDKAETALRKVLRTVEDGTDG